MMNMKILGGILFVRAMLKRIEIAKELLILEIELGNEVRINKELSQDHLALSFRYYDAIIRYIQTKIQPNIRDFYSLK